MRCVYVWSVAVFLFKQRTAYERRISDWSSDVCSSDLDVEGTLQQIYGLAAAGCDIVRCTCNEAEAAEGLAQIVPRSPVPVIADIQIGRASCRERVCQYV